MKRNSLFRAMLLAGLVAASGAVQAAFDELSSQPSPVQMQTWYFPDGSNHTVLLTPRSGVAGTPDTRVLGAGPASLPTLLPEEPAEEASNVITQTWFFPDGSNHTVMLPAAAQASTPDTTMLGAGSAPVANRSPESDPFIAVAP